MAQIVMPRKKTGTELLPMAGQAIGGIAGAVYGGGPAGAVAGASAGGQAGGMAAGMINEGTGETAKQNAVDNAAAQSPMARRMQQLDEDPIANIRQAQTALAYMPPEMKQEYGPPLDEAYKRAMALSRQNQQGVA